MQYEIVHAVQYTYDVPVELGPHVVRLLPRPEGNQRVTDLRWDIRPAPVQVSRGLDLFGNDILTVWFRGSVSSLSFRIKSHVETCRVNPFDFIAHRPGVPADYGDKNVLLAPYRRPGPSHAVLGRWVGEIRKHAQGDAGKFLLGLCHRIHSDFAHEFREEGAPRPPSTTLALKKGACRDLSVLCLEAVRRAGFAARFVSGYYDDVPFRGHRDLHAWVEVYVEGGGWRGYDPTAGLAVADRHVAVAAGVTPERAAPIDGTFFGSAKPAKLRYALSVTRLN